MSNGRQIVEEWVPERFFKNIEPELIEKGEYVLDWFISKLTMIAVLNYIRGRGYKCEWIEKGEAQFLIKISMKCHEEETH